MTRQPSGTPTTPLLGWGSPGIYEVDCSCATWTHCCLGLPDREGPLLYEAWDSLSFLALTATLCLLAFATPFLPQEFYELSADLTYLSTMFRFVYITEKPTLEQRLDIPVPISQPLRLSWFPGGSWPGSRGRPRSGRRIPRGCAEATWRSRPWGPTHL